MTNPKHLEIRRDNFTGQLFLVERRQGKPLKLVKDVTQDILFAMATEVTTVPNTKSVVRDLKFLDFEVQFIIQQKGLFGVQEFEHAPTDAGKPVDL